MGLPRSREKPETGMKLETEAEPMCFYLVATRICLFFRLPCGNFLEFQRIAITTSTN